MQLRFVDYCPMYFTELLEQPMPLHRGGKFVVLHNATIRYAVFSPRPFSAYHATWYRSLPKCGEFQTFAT